MSLQVLALTSMIFKMGQDSVLQVLMFVTILVILSSCSDIRLYGLR